ncbi:MAG: transglutaminase domain-containing protein, partial [Fuerstia sp.]|nr:transglutaminase domain-containing protein [Fuerstiella sp.]
RPDDSTEQDEFSDLHDIWFLIEYDDAAIGYESLSTTSVDVADGGTSVVDPRETVPIVRRSRETRLKLKRFANDLSVSAHLETIETTDGVLQSWSLRRTAADGSTLQRSATWNAARQGFLIHGDPTDPEKAELLQSRVQPRSPILPAWLSAPDIERPQQWASAVLFPETSAIVDVEIRQLPPQSLRLKDGSTIAVTRHDYWPTNQPELRSSVYYDNEQKVVLVEQPLLGRTLRFYRTDAATALGEENLQSLDLQFLTALPLRRPLLNPERSSAVRMMISVGASEQISLPASDFQAVEQKAANSVIVTLTRPMASTDSTQPATPPPNARRPDKIFTRSSRWIDSKDDNVRRMAAIAGGAVTDPHEKCKRLTSYLASHLRLSAFSTSLRPASEVVKTKQGDCTEYAVLLAAVMRSEGVPARVAVGFAYVPNPASFAPHMWTEAWINGQWIPFDATLGGEVNPLTRLKVLDSPLSDNVTSGTMLFIPLLNFLGRATVEILPEQ